MTPADITTPNASLEIQGLAGPPLIANAGRCNLHLPPPTPISAGAMPMPPPDQWVSSQPCSISGRIDPENTLPARFDAAVGAAAGAAGPAGGNFSASGLQFQPTCRFAMGPNLTAGCEAALPGSEAAFDEASALALARGAAAPLLGPTAGVRGEAWHSGAEAGATSC